MSAIKIQSRRRAIKKNNLRRDSTVETPEENEGRGVASARQHGAESEHARVEAHLQQWATGVHRVVGSAEEMHKVRQSGHSASVSRSRVPGACQKQDGEEISTIGEVGGA
jgi:hypothetical protein